MPIFRHKLGKPGWADAARRQHQDPEFRAGAEENILLRKNQQALGAFIREDRTKAIDYLGFASQLVFTTFCLGNFQLEYGDDVELAYAAATAHNRMMTDFCSVDRRLLATGYVPLMDFERAAAATKEAIELGAKAILIASRCPKGHSPSHIAFDPVWAQAEEAGLPILFHVGGEEKLNPAYFENGLPRVKDFHGGEENFTSVSFMPIPNSVMQTLACLIIDGVMDRFPKLKFGAIELGASWVPSWMRFMDSAHAAFFKNEERLHRLSAPPSEIVRRQVRVTPYPHEQTGWIIANSGRGNLPLLLRLPARGRRPQSAQALQRRPRGDAEGRGRPVLPRELHRPDGRRAGARPQAAEAPDRGLGRRLLAYGRIRTCWGGRASVLDLKFARFRDRTEQTSDP